ncbi:PilZ domain-containing protein [Rhabdochromatium marinum]|uniref:PilZ domain-containing protein n=1 Tax=Rhabdochromatium marinum TaxID=48729 RepID=UPI0019045FC5|nr:PilZ domain-containing protein [Rhabdochromatium marinum]
MSSIPAENRRVSPRNQIDCLIQLESLGTPDSSSAASNPHNGIVQDASESGARIWADQPYACDETLRIHFGCDKVGLREERHCTATVVWAAAEPVEGRWQIGIRFHPSEAAHAIAQALAHGCPWCEKLCPDIAASGAV